MTKGLLTLTLIGCSPKPDAAPSVSEHKPLVVFLVRHGEKADLSEDPELSVAERERAVALATTLRSTELEYVHSSDFIRTRDTAAPSAIEHGLEVELYNPRDLPALAEKLLVGTYREASSRRPIWSSVTCVETPALERLAPHLDPAVQPIADGSRELRLRWWS